MKIKFLLFGFFLSILSFGQANIEYISIDKKIAAIPGNLTTSTDGIADFINANFKSENDKIRAVFYWTASNISYDVKNAFSLNPNQTAQEKIEKALKTKKGVCIHYAEVFNSIANKVGVKSIIIEGFTKQNGKIAPLPHAWCGANIDGKWYVFDPTWGSGGMHNGKFVKKINNYYFKAEPSKIISSHIAFDYLWQFLNYPITNQEFYEGKVLVDKSKKYFDFDTELKRQVSLSDMERVSESITRIEANGIKNKMIYDYLTSKRKELEIRNQNENIEKLNSIATEYNQAIVLLNDFINYRNKKFKPTLPDYEILQMIQRPKEALEKCRKDIKTVGFVGVENESNLRSIKKSINEALAQAEEYELFVKDYLSKSKLVRKTMFTKVSWFGIPLN
jgi:transglutaminase/protease-like cytokinesis protein 3